MRRATTRETAPLERCVVPSSGSSALRADASRVGPGHVDPQDRFVDDFRATSVTGQQLAAELHGAAILPLHPTTRHPYLPCADLRRHGTSLSPVAIAASPLTALVGLTAKRLYELLLQHLDGIVAFISSRLTNARLEGMNNKIRVLSHRAYGFHTPRP